MYNDLRAPAVAGTFYPSDRSDLKELVNGGDDRFAVSTGFGVLLDRQVKLDFAYQKTDWQRQFSGDYLTGIISENASDTRLLLSLSYRY